MAPASPISTTATSLRQLEGASPSDWPMRGLSRKWTDTTKSDRNPTSLASAPMRLHQSSQPSELWGPNQRFDFATVLRSHANVEQFPRCGRGRPGVLGALYQIGPALHATSA